MIVVCLRGGLGNQMFQYAAALSLSELRQKKIFIDQYFFAQNQIETNAFTVRNYQLEIFKEIKSEFISDKISKKFKSTNKTAIFKRLFYKNYKEPHFHFDPDFFHLHSPVLINGYFNSEKYFLFNRSNIIRHFTFPSLEIDDPAFEFVDKISNQVSVSVHVRRGDYLKPSIKAFHGICSEEYYIESINFISKKIPGCKFFFFTDDPIWVKNNLIKNIKFSELITCNIGNNSWKDMYLMSLCNHNIIANSTFSWWGAWLNQSESKIVIAPKKWFDEGAKINDDKDLIPDNWIRL
jgi:hypothetical protein